VKTFVFPELLLNKIGKYKESKMLRFPLFSDINNLSMFKEKLV